MSRLDPGKIVETAARLFAARGYATVPVADIVDELGCTPPRLYRRFPSKLALLHAILDSALEQQECVGGHVDDYIARAIGAAADYPDLVVTYVRDRRWLDPVDFVHVAQRDSEHIAGWHAAIAAAVPGLAARAITVRHRAIAAIIASSAVAPRHAGGARLGAAFAIGVRDLVTTPPVKGDNAAAAPFCWHVPPTRRQQILDAAIALLGARGYADVRVDDVGRAVGIAGPSVLQHFTTKQQILVAAFDRGITQLMISATVAIDGADGAADALVRLVSGLAETAARNSDLFTTLVRESGGLDESDRDRILHLRRDYDDIWAAVVCQIWPQLGVETARAIARAGSEATLSGLRRPDDPRAAADLAAVTLAFINGTANTFENSRPPDWPEDRSKSDASVA
jgi:AcrR family transcriptional regulator